MEATADDVKTAQRLLDERQQRAKFLPNVALVEPSWDMLLFLFVNQYRLIPVGELCAGAGIPRTTALRYITSLMGLNLITRTDDWRDARVRYVRLSPAALSSLCGYLRSISG